MDELKLKRDDIIKTVEFNLTKFQLLLFNKFNEFLVNNYLNSSFKIDFDKVSKDSKISKYQIKKILSGDFEGNISILIKILIFINKQLTIKDLDN